MMSSLRSLSTDEICRRLGPLAAVKHKSIMLFGGPLAVREMKEPSRGWRSMPLGRNNETYLLARGAKSLGPEELRRSLHAAHYAMASESCRMERNPSGRPQGLYVVRDTGPTGWLYLPDPFASPTQTIARACRRKFETLRSEAHTKELLRTRELRIEVLCLWQHKTKLAANAVRALNEKLLLAVVFFALENLSWPN
jgi:hypothetical protein